MKTRSNLYSNDIVHMENYDTNDSVDSVDSNDNQITPSQDGSIFKASSLFYTIIKTVIICIYESMLYIYKNYIIETKNMDLPIMGMFTLCKCPYICTILYSCWYHWFYLLNIYRSNTNLLCFIMGNIQWQSIII